jgi:hypothetical protein
MCVLGLYLDGCDVGGVVERRFDMECDTILQSLSTTVLYVPSSIL